MCMGQLLCSPDVCEVLQISRWQLNDLCDARAIEYTVVGKRRRFTPAAIDAYLERRTVRAIQPGLGQRGKK
jgi:excisionase family DNA binding protein